MPLRTRGGHCAMLLRLRWPPRLRPHLRGGGVEDDEPQVVFTAIAEGTLPPAAQNRAPTPRSETGNRTPTPGTEEYQALIKFPGERGVMRASMIPFLLVIFRLMAQIRPHVEVGGRNRRGTTKWMELFDRFFDRADGTGRSFQMWVGDHGWKKFRKAVIAGVHGHAQAYYDNTGAPMEIQMLAHDLELEIMHANSELQADRGARAETEAAHHERLGAAEGGMGLTIPARGVQPPTLDFPLDSFQVQALAELGQNTVSPFNFSNSTAGRTTVTPHVRGSAFTPVQGQGVQAGNNLPVHPGPALPAFFADTDVPQNDFPPANLGQRARNDVASRQQSNLAAGNVGDRVVFPAGTRTRNPDQVDVLRLMNEQIMQGITSLSNLAPSAADQRRVQLESTLSSAMTRMAQYTATGRSTDVISRRIERLETELDAHTDAMFSL